MSRPTAATAKPDQAFAPVATPRLYQTLRTLVRALLERAFALKVEGLEHLPARGPYIVAANHHNYLDGVVLACALPVPICFLVMPRVWRATPLHPFFHRCIGSIPVDLDRPDPAALRRALDALGAGGIVGIFPEGPFSVRGRLERGRPGVGLLALRSGAAVVPAAIRGTYEALAGRRFYVPRRHPLRVRFGPPRHFTNGASANGAGHADDAEPALASPRAARRDVTDRIMADIADLLA
jgi:1-acyl-sn-glycerol-3-phosphate acyltransferase